MANMARGRGYNGSDFDDEMEARLRHGAGDGEDWGEGCSVPEDFRVERFKKEFLDPIEKVPDEGTVRFNVTDHCSGDTYHLLIGAGEFRRQIQAGMARLDAGDYNEFFIDFGHDAEVDLLYHDFYSVEQYTNEMRQQDEKCRAAEQQLDELETLGVPRELFYGRAYGEDTGDSSPAIPQFSPEQVLGYAEIIKKYLEDKGRQQGMDRRID